MSVLHRQVGIARRRLTWNRCMSWSAWGVLIASALWILAVLIERSVVFGLPLQLAPWVAAGLAALIALVGTVATRANSLQAALAIDSAAHLKERLSTALQFQKNPDEFAQAAVQDAERTAGKIHVPTHIAYRAPEVWPLSVAGVAAALLLMWLMPTLNLFENKAQAAAAKQERTRVESEKKALQVELNEQINRIKEDAKDNAALADLAKELGKLEMPDTPTMTPEDMRREALKKIDDVREKLEEKQKSTEFDALQETKRMLAQIKPEKGADQASKLSEALSKGDTAGAKEALSEMKKQLDESMKSADPQTKQQVAEMQQKMEKLADQVSKLSDTTQIQKELENKGGMTADEAKKVMEQISKMDPKALQKELQKQLGDKGLSEKQVQELTQKIQQNQQAQQAMKQMAQSMAQAAQAMQQCQSPGSGQSQAQAQAGNAMSNAMEQLSQMEMTEQLMNDMQAQMSELQNMRDGVCKGNGGGNGDRPGDGSGGNIGDQGPNYGQGLGERIGKEKSAHSMKVEKANTKNTGGSIIGQMLVDGPQLRGEATVEVRDAINAAQRDAQDAIEKHSVPRQYERVMREYFDRLAGLAETKSAGDKKNAAGDAKKAPAQKEESKK